MWVDALLVTHVENEVEGRAKYNNIFIILFMADTFSAFIKIAHGLARCAERRDTAHAQLYAVENCRDGNYGVVLSKLFLSRRSFRALKIGLLLVLEGLLIRERSLTLQRTQTGVAVSVHSRAALLHNVSAAYSLLF